MDWILVGHHEASGLTLIIHNGNMGLPVQGPKTKIHEIVTYFELSLITLIFSSVYLVTILLGLADQEGNFSLLQLFLSLV